MYSYPVVSQQDGYSSVCFDTDSPKTNHNKTVCRAHLRSFNLTKLLTNTDTKENCAEREGTGGSPKLMLTPSFLDVDTAA